NNRIIKICLLMVLGVSVVADASAQRAPKKRTDTGTNPQQNNQQQQQTNNATAPSNYNPYGNTPIRIDSTGGSDTIVRKSLRNDNAFDKGFVSDRTPLPYEHLRWDDALYSEKVWRELDLREKMNQPFRFDANDDNGSQLFVNILLKAINSGQVMAFSDDRFTTPIGSAEIQQMTVGTADTSEVRDINDPNKIVEYVVTRASFDGKSVMKLRIKEEWVFDREASRLFVRILGIAPVKTSFNPNGTERGSTPLFWVYYPDLRPILTKYEVYNPKNMGYGRMTWEELFESRMFSSYITKSTLDNAGNKTIAQSIKDPILRLLEGDNIKDRIFNYEQDLWSY
ncbi:MAG: type IX secretion system ring subunit PorN/GldN, partial [Flavisolibacter sp.]